MNECIITNLNFKNRVVKQSLIMTFLLSFEYNYVLLKKLETQQHSHTRLIQSIYIVNLYFMQVKDQK